MESRWTHGVQVESTWNLWVRVKYTQCAINEKYKKVHSLQACKPCTEIPACTSKVMRGQPQPCENINLERILFQLYLTQQNVFVPYEVHMIK